MAREACGGAGFLAENRLTGLRADLDVYATFEGDNTVLLQLVGKRLLADYSKSSSTSTPAKVARIVAERAADAALYRTPLLRAVQTIADVGDPRRSAGQLRETATQRELLVDRVETMVAEIAQALRPAQKADPATPRRCSTPTSTSWSRPPARTPTCSSGRRSPRRWSGSRTRAPARCSRGCGTCSG